MLLTEEKSKVYPQTDIFFQELYHTASLLDQVVLQLKKQTYNSKYDKSKKLEYILNILHNIKGISSILQLDNLVLLSHFLEDIVLQSIHLSSSTEKLTIIIQEANTIIFQFTRDFHFHKELHNRVDKFIYKYQSAITNSKKTKPIYQGVPFSCSDPQKQYSLKICLPPNDADPFTRIAFIRNYLLKNANMKYEKIQKESYFSQSQEQPNGFDLHYIIQAKKNTTFQKSIEKLSIVYNVDIQELQNKQSSSGYLANTDCNSQLQNNISYHLQNSFQEIHTSEINDIFAYSMHLITIKNKLYQLKDEIVNIAPLEKDKMDSYINLLSHFSLKIQQLAANMKFVFLSDIFLLIANFLKKYSKQKNKKIFFEMLGEKIKIEKKLMQNLIIPIIHVFNNAITHGFGAENTKNQSTQNKITFEIRVSNGHCLIIAIKDNGRGFHYYQNYKNNSEGKRKNNIVTKEILEKTYQRGFSTQEVADEISGRGLGLYIVRKIVKKLNGKLEIFTKKDVGTQVFMYIPLELYATKVLIAKIGEKKFSIPLVQVSKTFTICLPALVHKKGYKMLYFNRKFIGTIDITIIFSMQYSEDPFELDRQYSVIILNTPKGFVAIIVDKIIGCAEAIQKPFSHSNTKLDVAQNLKFVNGISVTEGKEDAYSIHPESAYNFFQEWRSCQSAA